MDLSYVSMSNNAADFVQLTTPINATGAIRFGMVPKTVKAYCMSHKYLESSGNVWIEISKIWDVFSVFLLQASLASFLMPFCKFILKPLGQVGVVGEILGGIIAGPSLLGQIRIYKRIVLPFKSLHLLETISSFGSMLFVFLVGVRTDMGIIRRSGKKAWIIGISTYVMPMLIAVSASFFVRIYVNDDGLFQILPHIAVLQSIITFHSVACFLEDLKLLNSEMGRLAISSSIISGFLGYTGLMVFAAVHETKLYEGGTIALVAVLVSGFVQVIFYRLAIRPLLIWMIKQTPEGEPIREIYYCIIVLLVLASSLMSEVMGQHAFFGPMVLGLVLPVGSAAAATLTDKFEGFVSLVFLPLFFLYCGARTNLTNTKPGLILVVFLIALISSFGKFVGTILPSMFLPSVALRDAVTLGLILNTYGFFNLQLYALAIKLTFIDYRSFSVMNTAAMLITGCVSPIVKYLYDPSVRYTGKGRRTIQHSVQNAEFRVLVCVHSQDYVPSMINLLEVSNPTRDSPIGVYLLHLVQLVGRATPLLVAHQASIKRSHSLNKSTESIISAFKLFEQTNESLVSVQAFTAIAPLVSMHNDVCMLALDKTVSLIILPFHMQRCITGIGIGKSWPKFRTVNLKIMEKAPCSVGILVDVGNSTTVISLIGSMPVYKIGVFFVGGPDDREAVAYAMRMATHPHVTITIIRVIPSEDKPYDLIERRLDVQIINKFRQFNMGIDKHVYREETVADAAETCGVIRSMENSFDLIMVGRRTTSPLLEGLSDWTEFPELGFVGDTLTSQEIERRVSVLVMQQHAIEDEEIPETIRRMEGIVEDKDFNDLLRESRRPQRWT